MGLICCKAAIREFILGLREDGQLFTLTFVLHWKWCCGSRVMASGIATLADRVCRLMFYLKSLVCSKADNTTVCMSKLLFYCLSFPKMKWNKIYLDKFNLRPTGRLFFLLVFEYFWLKFVHLNLKQSTWSSLNSLWCTVEEVAKLVLNLADTNY